MRYEEPRLEILLLEHHLDVITASSLGDSEAGGNEEGGSLGDLFGTSTTGWN